MTKSALTRHVDRRKFVNGRWMDASDTESDGDDMDRLQYIDAALYLPADLLPKGDRMSMAHSLEARVPFLDRAVVESSNGGRAGPRGPTGACGATASCGCG